MGYNAGLATYVSGTVGAAREAAFQHVPAMAVSMDWRTPQETMLFFADWAVALGERLVNYPVPPLSVCNINVPPVPVHELKEPKMCTLNLEIYKDAYEKRESPRGGYYFWCTPEVEDDHPTPGSDQDWLNKGHITCTFLTPMPCKQEDYEDFLTEL